ncbi:MAG: hypothetical protein VB102_10425 [Paludibacter sp.]|nr:hypothetical protein [Paludibacter sp.]
MKKKNYSVITTLLIVTLSIIWTSCEEQVVPDNSTDRLFRPAMLTANVNGVAVKLSWVPIAKASYYLELSRDSFQYENDLQVFSLDGVAEYQVDDLWSSSRYSVRIKAISKDSTIKDSEYKQIQFMTGVENIFYAINSANVSVSSVWLEWNNAKSVNRIVISTKDTPDREVQLSITNISEGKKLIDGLSANKAYTFKIYKGEMLRGTVSVMTKAS